MKQKVLPPDRSFLEIDQMALNVEWIKQPKLVEKWIVKLTKVRRKLDQAKADLEVTQAELGKDIRGLPDKYNIVGRVSERSVEEAMLVDPDYQRALKAVNDAKYELGLMEAVVTALDHKKRSLENLVQLHGMSYFAEPQARGEESRNNVQNFKKRLARRHNA